MTAVSQPSALTSELAGNMRSHANIANNNISSLFSGANNISPDANTIQTGATSYHTIVSTPHAAVMRQVSTDSRRQPDDIRIVKAQQQNQPADSKGYKRTFHIGGRSFLLFSGKANVIEHITILEAYNGRAPEKKLQLTPTRLQVLLSVSDQLFQELGRVTATGENDVSLKIHLGGGQFASVEDKYFSIGLRQWVKTEKGWSATKLGHQFHKREWKDLMKYLNEMYSQRFELHSVTSCLLNPNIPGHIPLLCDDCCPMKQEAEGEVFDIDIPL